MSFINFLYKPKNELEKGGRQAAPIHSDENEPSELCPNCRKQLPLSYIWGNLSTCSCGYHFRMNARQRINYICDNDTFIEMDASVCSFDVLKFPGYKNKLDITRNSCGEAEAVICGTTEINGIECCIFVMEPFYMMGSMGTAVGEKITRLFEYATAKNLPVVGFAVSGGARMQEGILSLMQMAKTSGAVKRHSNKGLFYLSILTDPTTGGVTASFAMLGDIVLAEPGATIGFAGARVIEQTTQKKLPRGFQKAEFLLEHGFVDSIVPRQNQKQDITYLLKLHCGGTK